jgi:Uma2 family endonuclease
VSHNEVMPLAVSPRTEHLVVLDHVSWGTYERLLAENDPGRGKRFTYDNGTLQIMVLSLRHELPNRLLAAIVEEVSTEWGLNSISAGSITVKRPDLHKGFEPDSCFYIGNSPAVRGKDELDFTIDPPPDLVIEVDITHGSLDKFPIFAAVGVPEVWRYDSRRVTIHLLKGGAFFESPVSTALPPLSAEVLTALLRSGIEQDRPKWIDEVRKWAKKART